MSTIKAAFRNTYHLRPDAVALRHKRDGVWREQTYRDLLGRVRQVSELLGALKSRNARRIGLFLDNGPEWCEIYLGITSIGMTAVPIDARLRPREVSHILRNAGATVVFADARTCPVLREAEAQAPELERVYLVGGEAILPLAGQRAAYADYEQALAGVRAAAADDNCRYNRTEPAPDDVASIIYTSGTTGLQKGAMLTHANFRANVEAAMRVIAVRADDNFLLVLPLHHALPFMANFLLPLTVGAEISLVESLKTVGDTMREVSPTALIGVPLLLEKMYDRIMMGLRRKPLAHALFRVGLRGPVRRGIRASLGGRLRLCVVGGAPCSVAVLEGFAALGIMVLEGYGLTETAPVLTFNPPDAPRPGTVGRALPGVTLKIMNPNAEGIGEIAARGPNVMSGYFNNPAATAEVMRDGWFLTGDLGRIDDDDYLVVTGRSKNLIVNREGKNIYPEDVEAVILENAFILEAIVLGYTEAGETGERVGAIVVPDQDAIAEHRGRQPMLNDADLTRFVVDQVRRSVKALAEYKRPRHIRVRTEEFEKTSTGKVKRYLYAMTPTDV